MTVTAKETFRSRGGDAFNGRQREYLVVDTDGDLDDNDAINAVADVAPDTLTTPDGYLLSLNNITFSREIDNGKRVLAAEYGEIGGAAGGGRNIPPGTVEYTFSYQAPSETIYFSLGTRAYAPPGKTAAKKYNRIKVDPETGKAEGISTAAGNTTNTWTLTLDGQATLSYEATVESLMGTVNNAPFKTRPIGTMRFVSCQSQYNGTKSTISFGMQYSPNVTNLQIGDILVARKDGHEYMWDTGEGIEDPAAVPKEVVWKAKAIYVEKVFKDGNFALLGI